MNACIIPLSTLTHPDFTIAFSLCEDGTTSAHSMRICCDRTTYTHKCAFDTHAEADYQLGRLLARGEFNTEHWTTDNHGVFDTAHEVYGKEPCNRCASGGQYIVAIENDKPVTRGTCYRCAGKGYHTQSDRGRNLQHDLNFVPVL